MKKASALAVLTFLAASCWAQQDSLLIGPGDQVHIQILEAPELEQHVRVTDAGFAPLILNIQVKIAGLSPAGAAEAVERALVSSNYLLHPHVSVSVDRFATQGVSVVGQVHLPGNYSIDTPRSILEILALAGGITEAADRRITIERRTTKEKILYVFSNKSPSALDTNVQVYPGDIVVVPKADIVYILGDVGRPGGYPMATNNSTLTVLEAISLAGSTPPSAVPSHTRLIRKMPDGSYVEIHLPLSQMQKGDKADVQLQADDILYVPFSYIRNMGGQLDTLVAAATTASIYRY